MAIAEVKSVINSCFINGSSAYVGQTIDYGDVIETYDISKGLQESFLSGEDEDAGYLNIEFLAKNKNGKPDKMSIKPHCKVIFKSGGAWAGANTVLLDPESENITLYKPKKKEAIARVMKSGGDAMLKPLGKTIFSTVVKPGLGINNGDAIRNGETGFAVIIFTDDRSVIKIRENTEFQFIDTPSTRTLDFERGTIFANVGPKGGTKTFIVSTPQSVAGVKG